MQMNIYSGSNMLNRACGPVIQIQRTRKPLQEVAHLSYLAFTIRRGLTYFLACVIVKGQDYRLQQEAAVRERARPLAVCI